MIKVLIVEDELIIAEDIKTILQEQHYNVVGIAMDYKEAIKILNENEKPDLVLLDVNLNDTKDGVDLAHYINENYKIPFIFATSYSDSQTLERAKKANPVNYLVKPFKKEQLLSTIEISWHKINNEKPKPEGSSESNTDVVVKDAIFLKDKSRYTKVELEDILWIKSDGNYLEIKTKKKEELIRASLSGFIEKLNSDQFFRTHKSYIVNLKNITNIETSFVLIGDTKIPLSKNYYDDLVKKLNII
ncbi:response regulator [Flavobacterium sp. NRK F10]|uniref:LytR/AlgR family response regulator transcription factor n=1 Tax=Flavobacterium sp. NRK F10 TaxID=2954931 RepID=UPI00209115DB|nr:response regulator [Flavobacterium sp. NRK F10]MCO6173913.1 response regulator [Flavobacterium sp. NRK F10]